MYVLGATILLFALRAYAGTGFFSFQLRNADSVNFSFAELKNNEASVLVFLSPECPLCQSYSLTLRELQLKFKNNGIEFYGIIPDKNFSNADVNAFKRKYLPNLMMLRDDAMQVTRFARASITPEVCVISKSGEVLYSGRIDNWAYELGKKRRVVTEHELTDALNAIIARKPVQVKKTKAIGCYIE